MLQVSDSLLIADSARGCSIPVKKGSNGFTTWVCSGESSTCAESRLITATGQALPGRTSYACWRHPTQEAFWYLPSDCDLQRESIHHAHSRGILNLAMELILILSLAHSTSHSRGSTVSCVKDLSIFTLVVIVNYWGHKPTHVCSRDNSVNCHEPLTLINYL